ncbi:MAG: hypothetical protein NTY09_09440 [bacterium]|nr:hypothetical protein [bacterium]
MKNKTEPPFSVVIYLIRGIYTQPAWLMAFFLFLVCLIAFADERSQFTGDPTHLFDPFGFSLLTPSTSPFNAHSMLSIAGFFMIPSAIIYWTNTKIPSMAEFVSESNIRGLLPLAGLVLYLVFLTLALPLLAISPTFRNPSALIVTVLDLIFLAGALSWFTSLVLEHISRIEFRAPIVWMVVGAFYLIRSIMDPVLIPPEAHDIVVTAWSMVVWHFILMVVIFTIHLLAIPQNRRARYS